MIWLEVSADICGILSFILTIALLFRSEALRKEIAAQKDEYQNNQKNLKIRMEALRGNLWEGQPINLRLTSEIRSLLFSFKQQYNRLCSHIDKKHIDSTLNMLNRNAPEDIDILKLIAELDFFVARFERKEIK